MKKVVLVIVAVLVLVVGYAYLSTKGDRSVKGNESFPKIALKETLTPLTLKDQFGELHSLKETTKKIIFVFKKDSGHVARGYLNKQKDNYLESRDIIFIADTSKMPAMIREYVAMPDLRERDYPVLVVYNQTLASKFKNEKEQEKIMVADIENFKVTAIHFVSTEDELAKLID